MFLGIRLRLLGFLDRFIDYLIRNLCFCLELCTVKKSRLFSWMCKYLLVLELEDGNRVYSRSKHIKQQLRDHVSCNFYKGIFYCQIPSSSSWTLDSDNYKLLKHWSSRNQSNLWTQFQYLHRCLKICEFLRELSLDPNVGYNRNWNLL